MDLPVLRTERLELRPLVDSDAPAVFEYAQLPEVSRWCTWDRHATLADAEGFLRWNASLDGIEHMPSWGIVSRADGRLLGTGGWFTCDRENAVGEIGYVLRPDAWGLGYMTESVAAFLGWGVSALGLRKAVARTMSPNAASMRVLQKSGFHRVRDEPAGYVKNGVPMDLVHWERDLSDG